MNRKRCISIILAVCMLMTITMTIAAAPVGASRAEQGAMHYYGDATLDDKLNTGDATFILQNSADMLEFTDAQFALTHESIMKVDADKNGSLNTGDAAFILRVCAGMEEANVYYDMAADEYTVKYHAGLPEEANAMLPADRSVFEGEVYTVTEAAEARGYKFMGYELSFDGLMGSDTAGITSTDAVEGKIYTIGDSFIMPSCNVILTATWQEEGEEPTPTDEPLQPGQAEITINYFDDFNEENVVADTMTVNDGQNIITADSIELPEGYRLKNPNFRLTVNVADCIASPSSVSVEIYPYVEKEGSEFKVVYNTSAFNKINNDLSKNYILGDDIDLGNENRYPFGWDWVGLSAEDVPFTGIFDGDGHTISGLYIEHTNDYNPEVSNDYNFYSNVGLFAINQGTICNVTVFTRLYDGQTLQYGVFGDVNVGVVAGKNQGVISDCHVYGNVGSMDYIEMSRGGAGGITGNNDGTVTRCWFEGGVEGFYWIGGLIGKNFGTLTESYFAGGINSGLVESDEDIVYYYSIRYVGGLCGGAQNADIRDCYVMTTTSIDADMGVGGLVGWMKSGAIHNCYVANLEINYITDYAGELVGYVATTPDYSGLYASDDYNINSGNLPSEFSSAIWDMQGLCYKTCPDLINNRRPQTMYTDD